MRLVLFDLTKYVDLVIWWWLLVGHGHGLVMRGQVGWERFCDLVANDVPYSLEYLVDHVRLVERFCDRLILHIPHRQVRLPEVRFHVHPCLIRVGFFVPGFKI